jgi:hypothetical protein
MRFQESLSAKQNRDLFGGRGSEGVDVSVLLIREARLSRWRKPVAKVGEGGLLHHPVDKTTAGWVELQGKIYDSMEFCG